MLRLLATTLFSLTLLSATAGAQTVVPKAYAPENLEQLNERDQVRVISLEYTEQSNGRQIPDDQLRFYLDQVDSGWTFSRIKEDIAVSLRGERPRDGGWNPGRPDGRGDWDDRDDRDGRGRGGNWDQATIIRCESRDQRPRECQTNFRGRAVVARQLSRTPCVEGRNWGQRPGLLWVNWGCRADFAQQRGGGNWRETEYGRYSVTCVSLYDRYTTCAWNSRFGPPTLVQRTSRNECIEGRSWGFRNGSLWVDRGCRGRFAPAYDW